MQEGYNNLVSRADMSMHGLMWGGIYYCYNGLDVSVTACATAIPIIAHQYTFKIGAHLIVCGPQGIFLLTQFLQLL